MKKNESIKDLSIPLNKPEDCWVLRNTITSLAGCARFRLFVIDWR